MIRSLRTFITLALAAAIGLLVAVVSSPGAAAQDFEVIETCAAYRTAVTTGGTTAVGAAEQLRGFGAPNPPGIESAIDDLIAAETPGSESSSGLFAAIDTLAAYYEPICQDIDACPLIRTAIAKNDGESALNARLARALLSPNPPGIDAAFALVGGEITAEQSPFHSSVAEAQAQLASFFIQCDTAPSTSDGPAPQAPKLAYTGLQTTSVLLGFAGVAMVASGLATRRIGTRLEQD